MLETERFLEPWGWVCPSAHDDTSLLRQEGKVNANLYLIAADIIQLTLHDGVWSSVNEQCGTLLDRAEEDFLSPPLAKLASDVLRTYVSQRYGGDKLREAIVGTKNGEPWVIVLGSAQIASALSGLADFLEALSCEGVEVVVGL